MAVKVLTIILNNLQQHVSALKSHLQSEYKAVHILQCHSSLTILYNIKMFKYDVLTNFIPTRTLY